MALRERVRELATGVYLTDEHEMLYVIDIAEAGQTLIVEDVRNGKIFSTDARELRAWRVVVPAVSDG